MHGQGSSVTFTDPQVIVAADVLREYEAIRDKYQKVLLPPEFKVLDSRQGIKKSEQTALNILSKSARFTETALKILKDCGDRILLTGAEDLLNVLAAHISVLKSEYAGLVVQSTFDEKVSKLYKTLDNNAATFSTNQIQAIRSAVELESARSQLPAQSAQPVHCRGMSSRLEVVGVAVAVIAITINLAISRTIIAFHVTLQVPVKTSYK